ncbi:hypothetical protein [Clostridium sp. KNHs216]|uniref:hypothetical protein n=1 Tax=Clostridium sp. KNHs216 TaxID=1550235 RepID=UPI001154BC4E|nr:hypothetical protein [Clostridium sp. KNHs216]TQI68989.1 hypothetical protein LY85_3737 [Clostridium sp. KNHs216]
MDELKPCPLQCNLQQLNERIINLGLGISQMGETGTMQVNKAFLTAILNYMEELLGLRRELENRRTVPENELCEAMTLDEAIKHCNDKAQSGDACGANHAQLRDWLAELKMLQYTPENKPLTLEQLRKMESEPVWVKSLLDGTVKGAVINNGGAAAYVLCGVRYDVFNNYGKTWLAYARKPEQEGRT